MNRRFRHFAAIDWSGAAGERHKGIAVGMCSAEGGPPAAQGWFRLRARGIETAYFRRGGLYAWLEQILNPRVPSTMPQVERDSIRALTMWFGGKMEVVDSATAPSVLDRELAAPRERDTHAAIGKIRRRAC